jgi:prepilin-type processing-associated H-X9-DG protein
MSNDPGNGYGESGDDDLEERKTRVIQRSDIVDRSVPEKGTAAPEAKTEEARPQEATPIPTGTVIGRTRLMSGHEQSLAGGGVPGATPTTNMTQPKTQYVHGASIDSDPVAGWVVVVKGPGKGNFRPVFVGMNSVGRDAGQRVPLNFGDESISREEHAFITYDEEQRCFYLQHGGKSNLVRLDGHPVLSPTELKANDLIRIGRTTLLFVPCCGPDFSWTDEVEEA